MAEQSLDSLWDDTHSSVYVFLNSADLNGDLGDLSQHFFKFNANRCGGTPARNQDAQAIIKINPLINFP